ncbi:MAG: hypothetical protein H0V81_16300 [Solirubrobacterales bacterium]|nr:hypothetical protein [Solirubrobacterales bacterium]
MGHCRTRRLAACVVLLAAVAAHGIAGTVSGYVEETATPGGTFAAAADWTAPSAAAAVVSKVAGGDPGYVRAGGSYHVYANVADQGNPAAGTASVNAGVGSLSTASSAAAATGSWTVGGLSYNWRSAALTAKAGLTDGSIGYSLTSTDSATPANARTQNFTTTADSTVPTGTAISSTNTPGGTVGRPEQGDTVVYTSSEPLEPISMLAGWSGAAIDVAATISDEPGTGDVLRVTTAAGEVPGTPVLLGRNDFVSKSRPITFGQTGTASTLTREGNVTTLVLGTPSATAATTGAAAQMRWSPSATVTDRAGNPMATTSVLEAANAVKEF